MLNSKILHFAVSLFILIFAFYIPSVQAAIIPCGGLDCTVDHVIQLLVNIYNFLLGMAAIVAMFFLVVVAIKFIVSGAFGSVPIDPTKGGGSLADAKKQFQNVIIGFILIACAYLIVNTLLTILGVDRTSAVGQLLIQLGFVLP